MEAETKRVLKGLLKWGFWKMYGLMLITTLILVLAFMYAMEKIPSFRDFHRLGKAIFEAQSEESQFD